MVRASEIDVAFSVYGVTAPLAVRAVRGREAIGELFRFDVDLTSDDLTLDLDACIGEPAHLVMRWGEVERHVDGIVRSFVELEGGGDKARFRAEVVPLAGLCDLAPSCRVFSDITVPELITSVLSENGVKDIRTSLTDSYERHELLVQYHETTWDLLSRWMEIEGIRCFFEHSAEGHTLVITDAPTSHDAIEGKKAIPYRVEVLDEGESVLSFELSRRIVPARVAVRDYPFDSPRGTKEESAEAKEGGKGSVFDFPARGAKKRLEALRTGERTGRGSASSLRLLPGRIFEIESHPRPGYNAEWLVTAVEHEVSLTGSESSGYRMDFECVPATTPYRPPRKTPWPRILGAQMATITGPKGAEIHTDADGRAQAIFHWDRGTDGQGTAVWLPLAQVAASRGFGTVSVPRVGDAVLVEFLDGDPARPVVTGRLYHKTNVHPYTLPGNRTKTVFRDSSSPGGDGFNELTFESAAGAEEVYLRAQRDSRIEVKNDAKRSVGNDDALSVEGDREVSVTGDSSLSVGGDEAISITGSQSVSVEASQTTSVVGDRSVGVGGNLQVSVEGNRGVAVEGADALEVTGDRTVSVSGSRTTTISGNDITSISGTSVTSISGSRAESVEGNLQLLVDGQTFESHGSLYVSVTGETSFTYSGDVKHESSTIQKIGAPKIYIAAGTNLYLRALESITLEVGGSKLTVEDGKVKITNGGSEKTLSGDTIYLNC